MRDGGKGDTPRPIKDKEQFDKNWDMVFKEPKKFFDRAREVAKKIDNNEYHTPED